MPNNRSAQETVADQPLAVNTRQLAGAEDPSPSALERLELRQRRSEFLIRCGHAGLSACFHKFNALCQHKYIQ